MIIKCPNCGCRYELQRKPPLTFHCRKCSFTVPFQIVLNEQSGRVDMNVTNSENSTSNIQPGLENETQVIAIPDSGHTKVVLGLADHTKVVPGLADPGKVVPPLQQKKGVLQVSYHGHPYSTIPLPFGDYDLGRLSSDGNAKIKITPDMSMSRTHAGMRTIKMNGQIVYQITSVKNENPVFVNSQPIGKGKACCLKNGDQIRMGDTVMTFRML